jgi:hypothetical protein
VQVNTPSTAKKSDFRAQVGRSQGAESLQVFETLAEHLLLQADDLQTCFAGVGRVLFFDRGLSRDVVAQAQSVCFSGE